MAQGFPEQKALRFFHGYGGAPVIKLRRRRTIIFTGKSPQLLPPARVLRVSWFPGRLGIPGALPKQRQHHGCAHPIPDEKIARAISILNQISGTPPIAGTPVNLPSCFVTPSPICCGFLLFLSSVFPPGGEEGSLLFGRFGGSLQQLEMLQVDSMRGGGPCSPCLLPEGLVNGGLVRGREADGFFSSASSSSSSSSSPAPSALRGNFIEHRVSKMETLAGVAIRYGVEVADIKRMNGLVTDTQMFAHKSLQIPLPGRHPPSPSLSNGSSPNGDQPHRDVLECFQSLTLKPRQQRTSPAMRSLQGYYGLIPPRREPEVEGTEMPAYKSGRALYLEDEPLPGVSPISDQHPSRHRKTRSLVDVFALANGVSAGDVATIEVTGNGEIDRASEKFLRMHRKIELDPPSRAPELLLKDDIGVTFSGRTGNRLALRPKAGSRIYVDSSRASLNPVGDSSMADVSSAVRKSSSTSNLQEPDGGSSIWPTSKWSLRPDAIARPFFDGLSKPMAARRNKAALD